jgi:hypothetical protein
MSQFPHHLVLIVETHLKCPNLLQGITAEQKKDVAIRLVQIDAKKEELYSLVSDLQRNYKIPGKIGQENTVLAHHLAVLVKPKPSDPYWYNLKHMQIHMLLFFFPFLLCLFKFMNIT